MFTNKHISSIVTSVVRLDQCHNWWLINSDFFKYGDNCKNYSQAGSTDSPL